MERTSVRLSPEISKKLQEEAVRMSEAEGRTVTVSDLLRACLAEKFPQVCARAKGGQAALTALRDEVALLSLRLGNLEEDTERLVQALSETVSLLSTRQQVDELASGITAVFKALEEKGS